VTILAVVAATLASYPLGLALGLPWLLPILNTAPAYVALVYLLSHGRRNEAVAVMLAWAAALAVGATFSFALWPHPVDALVVNGPAYRDEMFAWIRTGVGREGDVRQFLPQHVLHLLGFVALCLATASALSITMGAVLMNYMGFYVASLARAGVPPLKVLFFGWQPWALCRVASFCILGVVLAEPLLARLRGARFEGWRATRGLLTWAAAGILADWILKATLAPLWGRVLRAALE
jgi:hypothetical protein